METQITWTIAAECLSHTRKAEELFKAMMASGAVSPEDENQARSYAHFLCCTRGMSHPADARTPIKDLADFLARWEEMTPAELWDHYIKEIPQALVMAWHTAYNSAQALFEPIAGE